MYHYAGNNPVRYIDSDGRDIVYQDDEGNEVFREISEKDEIHTPSSDLKMMKDNAKEMQENKLNIILFAKNVKTGGKWDFKDKNNPEHRSFYWFEGKLVTAEEFGNIHYGYVGAAGGFGLALLKDAPGIVQVNQNTAELNFIFTNFDDPRDTNNILKGFISYESTFTDAITNLCSDLVYKSSGLQNAFKCYTGFSFFAKSLFGGNK